MDEFPIRIIGEDDLAILKRSIREALPSIRSGHRAEILAARFGLKTYASLKAEMASSMYGVIDTEAGANAEMTKARAAGLGISLEPDAISALEAILIAYRDEKRREIDDRMRRSRVAQMHLQRKRELEMRGHRMRMMSLQRMRQK